jgi:hypothetical protein
MKQLANIIHLAPSFRVSSVTGNTMVMKSGFTADKFPTYNDVEPSIESSRKAAGILYTFQLKVGIDKLSDAQKQTYANNAPVILNMFDADTGANVIIGTPTAPALISVNPGVNTDQLVIEYASKTPVL